VRAGVDWVQVRERALEGVALLEHARAVAQAARAAARERGGSVRVIVNRRADVALACGADGIHLGQDAMRPGEARALLGPETLVGVSCHGAAELAEARGASYAQLAPIFAPLSKAASRPALGLAALAAACDATGLPILAQGGIDPGRAAAAVAAGAAGVAVTGAILMAPDPGAAAAALRRALDSGARSGAPMGGA
jgi:thiamine-phosphate pyrophosphorylase